MTERPDKAETAFRSGYSCSESIMCTYANDFGMDSGTAMRVSSGMASGMAGLGETCGAVSGAFLILGLRHGRTTPSDKSARKETFLRVREFAKRFTEHMGSTICRDIRNPSAPRPSSPILTDSTGAPRGTCQACVRLAAELLEDMLQ